jgi:hypothetical protein
MGLTLTEVALFLVQEDAARRHVATATPGQTVAETVVVDTATVLVRQR